MSKPKRVDADSFIRQVYEGEDTGQQGAFPEDTLASVPHVEPRSSDDLAPDTTLSGGDVDATWSGTDDGEEAVGGSTPTPDQDMVDELGKAAGVTYEDGEPLRFGDKVADRDAQRWELNPASSEGFQERARELSSAASAEPMPLTRRPPVERPTRAAKAGKDTSRRGTQKRAPRTPDTRGVRNTKSKKSK